MQTIVLETGQTELNLKGFEGLIVIVPAEDGNTIESLVRGAIEKFVMLQIDPSAQDTVIMVNNSNLKLEGNINWEMTNEDVLMIYFTTSFKAIELSRVDR